MSYLRIKDQVETSYITYHIVRLILYLVLAIVTYLLILQSGLDEIEREDAGDADDARDPAVDDLRQESKVWRRRGNRRHWRSS